jgi:hypothetical protein
MVTLRKLRQKNHKFKSNLGYIVRDPASNTFPLKEGNPATFDNMNEAKRALC